MQMKDPVYCQDVEFNQMPASAFGIGGLVKACEPMHARDMIIQECNSIKTLLLSKNEKYGDSALSPRRIMSKASTIEQLLVRIDDKLSRIMNGSDDEDSVQDLIGYLILLRVARRLAK